ncbi:hypothetical protein ACFSHT_27115 [Paraburkholderia silviterrae]|uniref:hypothetical protein n=1 Tax=Paraburkholderia silviterrae TaxID=2528715 RepID=UPI00196A59FC|nr:hypothetical protein [Paraburkholderia silviterrae]
MGLSIFGIVVIVSGLAALYASYRGVIYGIAVYSLLGCAIALSLGGTGVMPAQLFLAFFALRAFNLVGGRKLIDAFSLDKPGFWLLCTCVWGVAGAIVLPRLLGGSTLVFPVDRDATGAGQDVLLRPLGPVAGNLSQAIYCIADTLIYCCMYAFLQFRGAYRTLANAILLLTALNVLAGMIDIASHTVGVDALAFVKTAQFAYMPGAEMGGLVRISGTFSETSSFSGFTLPLFVFCLNLWLVGFRPKLSGVLAAASGMLLLLSTSGTAYVGLGGYLVVLLFSRPHLIARAACARKNRMWAFSLCMGVLGALYVVLFLPAVADALTQFVDTTIFNKAGSSSGVERMGWNAQGVTNFLDTFGIGVGLGSIRASSFLVALLANLGIVGVICYGFFIGKSVLSPVPAHYPFTERAVCYAARHSAISALIVASAASSVFDLGTCFYLLAAAAGALSLPAPRRAFRARAMDCHGLLNHEVNDGFESQPARNHVRKERSAVARKSIKNLPDLRHAGPRRTP